MASNEKTSKKELCFIITPIGEASDPIRRHIDGIINESIIPALSNKYEVKAAHHISEPGTITKQVIEAIYNAKLVVANLTSRNPNVMYELALRHAIGKPVIMIVEEGTKIPSDIVMQRIISYHNDAMGTKELRDALKKAESEIVFGNHCGPIHDVLGDISNATQVLNKAAEENADIKEPLEYILLRLDRIENSITSSESRIIPQNQEYVFCFTYESFSKSDIADTNWSEVYNIDEYFPGVRAHSISRSGGTSSESGTIEIALEIPHPRPHASVIADWLIGTLSSIGFHNVTYTTNYKVL